MQLLLLNSDIVGAGNKELGEKLMISFLNQLVLNKTKIDAVFCVNSGVFLTTTNKPASVLLEKIENQGAVISSCGTCLDFYNLKDMLAVGEIGTMDLYVQLMSGADKVLSI